MSGCLPPFARDPGTARLRQLAPTGAAITRRSVTLVRHFATLLGCLVVTCHDTASCLWSESSLLVRHSSRTTFFTTSLLTSARRGWTRGISATPLASCAVIPAPAPYSLSIVNFRSCSSAHHGVMCCAWLNYLLFCDLPVLFSRPHAKLILFSASLS